MSRTRILVSLFASLGLATLLSAPSCTVTEAAPEDNHNTGGGGAGTSDGGAGGGMEETCPADDPDACQACIHSTCCQAKLDCQANDTCWACVTGTDGTQCGTDMVSHALATTYLECLGGPCNEACIGSSGSCEEASEVYEADCGACLEQNCCDELGACYAHQGCWVDCVTMHNSAGCHEPNAHALFYALGQCAQTSCNEACIAGPEFEPACEQVPEVAPSAGSCITVGGANACNPITNEGCEAGEACDVNQNGDGFQCFPPPNTQALCAECGQAEGYCAPGHTCAGSCVRFCCTDEDCGPTGTCDDALLEGLIGLCVVEGG